MNILTLKNITKCFEKTEVLRDINLSIESGEFIVFVGPSGCGKSTLLRMIAGLEPQTSGDMYLDECLVNDEAPGKRGLAMVFQSYALYPHMSVYDNMAFALKTAGKDKNFIETQVQIASKTLQLDHLLTRKPSQLSGGQRQRVAIGRAIVRQPKIFLFDEPLSNLDAELRVDMRVEIAALHKKLKSTMIYVTHDQVEAMTLADRIVVLHDGIVEQFGTPLQLYNQPYNKFVAGFIGSPRINFISGQMTHSGFVSESGDRVSDANVRCFDNATCIGIRPKDLTLSVTKLKDSISAEVSFVEVLGDESCIHCLTDTGQRLVCVENGQLELTPRQKVWLKPNKDKLTFFNSEGINLHYQFDVSLAEIS